MATLDEFDISDDIDFSAIGEEEWSAIQTQTQIPYSSQQSSTIPRLPASNEDPNDLTGTERTEIAVPEFIQGSSTSPVAQVRREETPSSEYFSDADDIDDAFLHELDELETRLMNGSREVVPKTHTVTVESNPLLVPRESLKRRRIEEFPTQKGKAKYDGDWTELLDEYEDEINCPICCDVLVAAHLVNSCGHTLCGSCGYQWIVEKHRNTCPVCRTECHALTPLIPNITVDNLVQTHLSVRASLGDEGWKVGGLKLVEWQARKDQWVNDCAQRKNRVFRPIWLDMDDTYNSYQ